MMRQQIPSTLALVALCLSGCAEQIDSPAEFIQLARLKERQEDLPAAIDAYTKAIELDEQNAETWYDRGVAFIRTGQPEKAIADYTRAVELDPDFSIAWNNRAAAFASLENYGAAIRDCSRAIEIDPADVLAWRNRGLAFHDLAQLTQAIDDLRQAVGLDPSDVFAHLSLGNALLDAGYPTSAVAEFTAAIDMDDEFADAWRNRAIARARLGLERLAADDLQQARRLGLTIDDSVSVSHLRAGPVSPVVRARLEQMRYRQADGHWRNRDGDFVWVIATPASSDGSVRVRDAELRVAAGQNVVLIVFTPTTPQRVVRVVEQWEPDASRMRATEFSLSE